MYSKTRNGAQQFIAFFALSLTVLFISTLFNLFWWGHGYLEPYAPFMLLLNILVSPVVFAYSLAVYLEKRKLRMQVKKERIYQFILFFNIGAYLFGTTLFFMAPIMVNAMKTLLPAICLILCASTLIFVFVIHQKFPKKATTA